MENHLRFLTEWRLEQTMIYGRSITDRPCLVTHAEDYKQKIRRKFHHFDSRSSSEAKRTKDCWIQQSFSVQIEQSIAKFFKCKKSKALQLLKGISVWAEHSNESIALSARVHRVFGFNVQFALSRSWMSFYKSSCSWRFVQQIKNASKISPNNFAS